MKEFTKSLFSYSLAMTFFGLKQVDNLMTATLVGERKPLCIKSLDSLTSAAVEQFGETLKSTFNALDNAQRGLVELMFAEPRKSIDLVVELPRARDVDVAESYRRSLRQLAS